MKNRRLLGTSVLLAGIYMASISAGMAGMTGRQVMDEQKKRHESVSEFEKVKMVLIDSANKQEVREVVRYSKKGSDDLFKYLLRFESPADVRGVSLLTWQQKGREDDQWLYLPALGEKMKRIAGGGKKSYFMGTDFAYEDLRSEKLDDHAYNVVKEDNADGKACYVIEALPANEEEKRSSGYSKRLMWVAKDTYVSLKVEYYDQGGKLMKTATSFDLKPVKGDMMRAGKVLMEHHLNKHKTVMGTVERAVNEPVDNAVFTERTVLSFK